MIIEVRQTNANLKKEFEINYNGEQRYTGKQTGLSSRNPSWMLGQDGSVLFKSAENKKSYWRNRMKGWLFTLVVLFAWLAFDRFQAVAVIATAVIFMIAYSLLPRATEVCAILDGNDEKVACFRHVLKSFLSYYSMECGGREYRLYDLSRSHYRYLSVYHGDTQIAQINKDLHTTNNRDDYSLYLLDEESAIADLLTMFILYFDNYEYGNQGEVFIGQKKNWSWTWSMTDRFYDETWISAHFGSVSI